MELRILATLRRKVNYHKYRSILQDSFFQEEQTKQVFKIIDSYFSSEKSIARKLTVVSLKLLISKEIRNKELQHKCIELASSLRKYKTKDTEVIEEIIKDFSKRQLVKQGILAGLEELDLPNPDFSKIQDKIDKAILVGASTDKNFYNYFEDPEGRIIQEKEERRICTGIPILDKYLGGGFGYGELIVILAPPERGKTLSMVNFGTAALFQGMTVGYLTLEIAERKVARRFDLRITGRPIELLRKDPGRVKNPLSSLRKNGCDLIIKDYSSDRPKIEDIKSFIITYQAKMKKKFDLLCVDYADLICPSRPQKQERFGLKEVYADLRRLANYLHIPIITASQATRKSMDKNVIDMKDFAECIEKAAIADIILGLCQTPEELEDSLCRFYIAKNRETGIHKIVRLTMKTKLMFMGEFDRMEEVKHLKLRKQTVADLL